MSEGRLHRVAGQGHLRGPPQDRAWRCSSPPSPTTCGPAAWRPARATWTGGPCAPARTWPRSSASSPGEEVHFIERLRTADGEPMCDRARAHPGQAGPRPGRARPVRQVAVRAAGEPLRAGHGRGRAHHRRRHRRPERRRPAQTPSRRSRAAAAAQILLRWRLRANSACPPTAPTATSSARFWRYRPAAPDPSPKSSMLPSFMQLYSCTPSLTSNPPKHVNDPLSGLVSHR